MTPKHQEKLREAVDTITKLYEVDPARAAGVIAKARQDAHAGLTRAKHAPDAEQIEIVQTRGPTLEFVGKLLYSDDYRPEPRWYLLELYTTLSGKFVAVWEVNDEHGGSFVRAKAFDGDQTMEILDWLEWGEMARTMAKKMGWPLKVSV